MIDSDWYNNKMIFQILSAVEPLNAETERQVAQFFIFVFIAIIISGVGGMIAVFIKERMDKKVFDETITFDENDSQLLKGSRYIAIPDGTIEYYVCKMVFSNRNKFQSDSDIIEAFGGDEFKLRPVYQAVLRVNKKAESKLGIENLLVRGKDKTALNEMYR